MTDADRTAERDAQADRPEKVCGRCQTEKPRAEFNSRSRARVRDGLAPWCKACMAEYNRGHYAANREKKSAQAAAWYEAHKDERREQIRAYRLANLDREARNRLAWLAANPGAQTEFSRKWREANREHVRELSRAWRAANADRERERKRRRYAEDPERFVEEAHQRRALIRGATVGPIDYPSLWTGICGICSGDMDRALAHPDPMSKSVDHIVPLALGGGHVQCNLQYAHLRCNVGKGARLGEGEVA